MATATKPEALKKALDDYREKFELCEELGFSVADPNHLSLAQLNVFRQAGITERSEVDRYVARCQKAKRLISEAGSKSEFEADKEELRKASAIEAKERPILEAKILALEEQLRKVGEETKRRHDIVERKRQVRQSLRDLAPPPQVDEAHHLRTQVTLDLAHQISNLKSKIQLIDEVNNHGPTDEWSKFHVERMEDSSHFASERKFNGMTEKRIDAHAWTKYGERLEEGRADLEAELADLEAREEQRRQQAQSPLGYYLQKFGL